MNNDQLPKDTLARQIWDWLGKANTPSIANSAYLRNHLHCTTRRIEEEARESPYLTCSATRDIARADLFEVE